MLAPGASDVAVVDLLTSGGADIRVRDSYGMTSLKRASSNGRTVVGDLLISGGLIKSVSVLYESERRDEPRTRNETRSERDERQVTSTAFFTLLCRVRQLATLYLYMTVVSCDLI